MRTVERGRPHPWIVPRITRCDAVYEEIERFHDRWLMVAGSASIDPLPNAIAGQRIAPMPKPKLMVLRDAATRLTILSDGSVPLDERTPHASTAMNAINTINAISDIKIAWRSLIEARRAAWHDGGHTHANLKTIW
jgi:hypothetical protein